MSDYTPPYTVTEEIVNLIARICAQTERLSVNSRESLRMHRIHRLQSIQGSLAIEGNTLSIDQITAVFEGKTVLAPPREIQEVKNALATYDIFDTLNPFSTKDLLRAHSILTSALIDQSGQFRSTGVGVMSGKKVVHLAPPASRVPVLIDDLFTWIKKSQAHPLITSSVFHYEFEFIHPFADGNGRMGRLWQSLLLSKWNPLFAYLPVENLILKRQQLYYTALQHSTKQTDSAPFVTFMLNAISDKLTELISQKSKVKSNEKSKENILHLILEQPTITTAHLAKQSGLSLSGVEKNVRQLKQAGLLKRIGPDKGGRWEVINP